MSNDIDIHKLAELARIDIDEESADELTESIEGVLEYVASVEDVAGDDAGKPEAGPVRNVLREDRDPHAPDQHREALLREAPAVNENGFIIVPPIL